MDTAYSTVIFPTDTAYSIVHSQNGHCLQFDHIPDGYFAYSTVVFRMFAACKTVVFPYGHCIKSKCHFPYIRCSWYGHLPYKHFSQFGRLQNGHVYKRWYAGRALVSFLVLRGWLMPWAFRLVSFFGCCAWCRKQPRGEGKSWAC